MLPAMRRIHLLIAIAAPLVLACACKKSSQKAPEGTPAAAPPKAAAVLALDNPKGLNLKAPDVFRAKLTTSKGDVIIEVHREWAPFGADRFYNLVKAGYFNDTRFFRVISGFMAQIGIHGKPEINAAWSDQQIQDDPVVKSNRRGFVTFAKTGAPNSRTTQFFINLVDNTNLDGMGFAPFGQVTSGMQVVDSLYAGYGEGAPRGQGPLQGRIQKEGNSYLMRDFPQLDFVKEATIVQ